MSTPDQPDTPALTRRQLREIRNTGSTPVITPDAETPAEESTPTPPTAAPLARAAEPAPVAPAPVVEPIDLGVSPLTRRQARQQERIRTASVPVITPDVAAAHHPVPEVITTVPARSESAPVADDTTVVETTDAETSTSAADDTSAEPDAAGIAAALDTTGEPVADERVADQVADEPAAAEPVDAAAILDVRDEDEADDEPVVQVNPALGSGLLGGEAPVAALPASFDQLIARSASSTGALATPNALILSQTPTGAPLVAPVTATGEVLITGTFELPEGLGSIGHAPGVADGKDLDIALIDGELPPASSPTPIAASAAISTVRNSGEEIIRPPLPDKSNRLTLALVITIGVLALAVAGVLVFAITTGRI